MSEEHKHQNELNHKESEHQLELNTRVQINERKLQHVETIHQQDLDHAHKLECLKMQTFKEILEKLISHLQAKNTTENLMELMIFHIIPLLDPSKMRKDHPYNNPQEGDNGARTGDMIDVEEETDFGVVESRNGTVTNIALDADEREVMELLGTFIQSAQDLVSQQKQC